MRRVLIDLRFSLVLLQLVNPSSSCQKRELTTTTFYTKRCREGQPLLDSANFISCKSEAFSKLVARGTYLSRTLQSSSQVRRGSRCVHDNYDEWSQAPEDSLSVCEYLNFLLKHCMPAYSSSTCRSSQEIEEIQRMWTQQAVSDTELYGSHGEILSCENITKVFNETEINQIASMLSNDEHWRHLSRYIF